MTEQVRSADGTTIAYDRYGSGAALVVIGGAFNDRSSPHPLVDVLASDFTVYSFDRRGRGDSGNTLPWSIEREVDDLSAVLEAAGGEAMVYGHSSGAALALEGALAGLPIRRLAVYEPPYTENEFSAQREREISNAVAAGDNDLAAATFMQQTGMDDATVAGMKHAPFWPGLAALAPTLPYDLELTAGGSVPERFSVITVPTLALAGGISAPWAGDVADQLVALLPDARRITVEGEHHGVDQQVLAPILAEWFAG